MKFKTFLSVYLPALLWMALIFYISSIPHLLQVGHGIWDFIAKKLAHMLEYGILFILLLRVFIHIKNSSNNFLITARKALVFSLLYAISDEYHQSFVFGRHATWRDVGVDLMGMLIVLFLVNSKKIRLLNKLIFNK